MVILSHLGMHRLLCTKRQSKKLKNNILQSYHNHPQVKLRLTPVEHPQLVVPASLPHHHHPILDRLHTPHQRLSRRAIPVLPPVIRDRSRSHQIAPLCPTAQHVGALSCRQLGAARSITTVIAIIPIIARPLRTPIHTHITHEQSIR